MHPIAENSSDRHDGVSVDEIVRNQMLAAVFQPIVSASRKTVSGVEGLIRGIDPLTGEYISPAILFDAAHSEELALEFDRACRDRVLEVFFKIYQDHPNHLIFLNVDASILEKGSGSNYLLQQVEQHGIRPENVVIELNEARVFGNAALKKFADTYRKHGFLIALDDVGTGFSNMDRILLVKPDIIKIDISLVRNIHQDFYKQGIFKSLVNLANKVGALVIAQGVETEDEALWVLRLGGHMIQGYFFSVPQQNYHDAITRAQRKVEQLSRSYNEYMVDQIKEEQRTNKERNQIASRLVKRLSHASREEFDGCLFEQIKDNKQIECAYILDEYGIQISETVGLSEQREHNLIFFSAKRGADHSMEKYYYPLISTRSKTYMTEPYTSLATGGLCITISKLFACDAKKLILCIDFKAHDFACNRELKEAMLNCGNTLSDLNGMIGRINDELIRDSLTHSYNRRYIEEKLLVDVYKQSSEKQPISILLADLDHFKEVNDTFGHLAGDQVLKEFVKIAKRHIRRNFDWIARYGGDEFLIVLPDADEQAAHRVAEKIRIAFEQTVIQYHENSIHLTASFGFYTVHSEKLNYEQLIGYADKSLYLAKRNGRNRISSVQDE